MASGVSLDSVLEQLTFKKRTKMKILIFNTTYNLGSTGKITKNMRDYFISANHEVAVCYGRGKKATDENVYRVSSPFLSKLNHLIGRLFGLNDCLSIVEMLRVRRIISAFKPDVVYLGNLHGYYLNIFGLYRILRKTRIPTIQIMWDEYPMTGKCCYHYECMNFTHLCRKCPYKNSYPESLFFDNSTFLFKKKQKAYDMPNLAFVGVSSTIELAKKSALLADKKTFELDEAVNQEDLYYPRNNQKAYDFLGVDRNKIIILNVCAYPNSRKGGEYFIQLAEKCIDCNDFVFVHIGFSGDKKGLPSNFVPVGVVKDQDLMADCYSAADLFVCTSLADTQPNACLEALSCGTPILGFDISGIPTCAEYPYGKYVEPKNVEQLKEEVLKTKKKTSESIEKVSRYAKTRFSSKQYNINLEKIGFEMLKKEASK